MCLQYEINCVYYTDAHMCGILGIDLNISGIIHIFFLKLKNNIFEVIWKIFFIFDIFLIKFVVNTPVESRGLGEMEIAG